MNDPVDFMLRFRFGTKKADWDRIRTDLRHGLGPIEDDVARAIARVRIKSDVHVKHMRAALRGIPLGPPKDEYDRMARAFRGVSNEHEEFRSSAVRGQGDILDALNHTVIGLGSVGYAFARIAGYSMGYQRMLRDIALQSERAIHNEEQLGHVLQRGAILSGKSYQEVAEIVDSLVKDQTGAGDQLEALVRTSLKFSRVVGMATQQVGDMAVQFRRVTRDRGDFERYANTFVRVREVTKATNTELFSTLGLVERIAFRFRVDERGRVAETALVAAGALRDQRVNADAIAEAYGEIQGYSERAMRIASLAALGGVDLASARADQTQFVTGLVRGIKSLATSEDDLRRLADAYGEAFGLDAQTVIQLYDTDLVELANTIDRVNRQTAQGAVLNTRWSTAMRTAEDQTKRLAEGGKALLKQFMLPAAEDMTRGLEAFESWLGRQLGTPADLNPYVDLGNRAGEVFSAEFRSALSFGLTGLSTGSLFRSLGNRVGRMGGGSGFERFLGGTVGGIGGLLRVGGQAALIAASFELIGTTVSKNADSLANMVDQLGQFVGAAPRTREELAEISKSFQFFGETLSHPVKNIEYVVTHLPEITQGFEMWLRQKGLLPEQKKEIGAGERAAFRGLRAAEWFAPGTTSQDRALIHAMRMGGNEQEARSAYTSAVIVDETQRRAFEAAAAELGQTLEQRLDEAFRAAFTAYRMGLDAEKSIKENEQRAGLKVYYGIETEEREARKALNLPEMDEGGIVRYRPGGKPVRVAERRDEAITPIAELYAAVQQSQMSSAGYLVSRLEPLLRALVDLAREERDRPVPTGPGVAFNQFGTGSL